MTQKTSQVKKLETLLPLLHKTQKSLMIWGTFGVGKSSIVKQYAKDNNMEFIDLRLSTIEGTDLRGIPVKTEKGGVEWVPPAELLVRDSTKKGKLIFLDEINAAPPSVQAPAYGLVLDRRIGENIILLPEDMVVAAGNLAGDNGATFDMASPLANRFYQITLEPTMDEFLEYAVDHNMDPLLISYIKMHPNDLHNYKESSGNLLNSTPRSWEMTSDLLSTKENYDVEFLDLAASGYHPSDVVGRLRAYFLDAAMFPSYDSILAGKPDRPLSKQFSHLAFSFLLGAFYFLKKKNYSDAELVKAAEALQKFFNEADNQCLPKEAQIFYMSNLVKPTHPIGPIIMTEITANKAKYPNLRSMYDITIETLVR